MRTILCAVPAAMLSLAGCQFWSADPQPADVGAGVPLALAETRAAVLSDIRYQLELAIPQDPAAPIDGRVRIDFTLSAVDGPLFLDFVGGGDRLGPVTRGDEPVAATAEDEHIRLPAEILRVGENSIELSFQAGDGPLNRRDDYLYALFVPDRAREAFPCFDQPDLKARFELTLEAPSQWQAISNGALAERSASRGRTTFRFQPAGPISTYLFTFAAGRFQTEEARVGGRRLRFYHRETSSARVRENRDALFELHAAALDWLEEYTGIEYPFDKFEFALLPAFQYGGMEHPGAVFYRDTRVFLGPDPTSNELLGRASLIAHETAHMWFGNLVTMRWFDDVWTKEVFANFMAARIVSPSFPDVDHQLRFLLAHQPTAYDVDRSRGTHPIRQPLENLNDAASLYGAIIYQKAPVVMMQLESLIGEEAFREGLREYLGRFQFANATWPDLIEILDARTTLDLTGWSRLWIEEAGRPRIRVETESDDAEWIVALVQEDPMEQGRRWVQQLETLTLAPGSRRHPVRLEGERVEVARFPDRPLVLPDVSGIGYAEFVLDDASRLDLVRLSRGGNLTPMARAATWMTLWEDVLEDRFGAGPALTAMSTALPREDEPLLIQYLLSRIETLYWRFLSPAQRVDAASELEAILWERVTAAPASPARKSFFRTWSDIVLTTAGVERLRRIWSGEETVEGLELNRDEFTDLAVGLAVRDHPQTAQILARELEQIDNPERRSRLEFLLRALSPEASERLAWFEDLKDPAARRREPWVLSGLGAVHHPLRAAQSIALIEPALELLEDVQATGDVFFPRRWADAVLGGHGGPRAAEIVEGFLEARPDYPPRLREKILQSGDLLFRSSR